jgi:RNA polymerase sigma factor (sigma-70 family)
MGGRSVSQYLPIVEQEVRRRMALGVPRGVDRSDVQGEAEEALVVAVAKGTTAIRLAVRNAIQDLVRHEAIRLRSAGEMPEPEQVATPRSDQVDTRFDFDVVITHLADLTPRQRKAISLVYRDGLTQEKAAERMKCTREAVKYLLTAGLKRLKVLCDRANAERL